MGACERPIHNRVVINIKGSPVKKLIGNPFFTDKGKYMKLQEFINRNIAVDCMVLVHEWKA